MHKNVRLALRVTLLLLTLLDGVGMTGTGLAKFRNPRWHDAFVVWGDPMWFMYALGVFEMIGGLSLFVPRLAAWAALALMSVMIGAVATTAYHPIVEHRFTWATPALHLCILSAIAAMRWKERWRRPVPG